MSQIASGPDARLETRDETVSGWSVGQQLQHLVRADASVAEGLLQLLENPSAGDPFGPTLLGRLILWLGFIPRGKGRAPRSTRAEESPAADEVRKELEDVRSLFHECRRRSDELLALERTLAHPVFGGLTIPQWFRFVEVHHEHHLKIVREIRSGSE
ncbi:MAG: DinB family protein [Thermoanaerobaculia bacterium]|nr:DinB family protein [Thermoanaerobaculia bacterium]